MAWFWNILNARHHVSMNYRRWQFLSLASRYKLYHNSRVICYKLCMTNSRNNNNTSFKNSFVNNIEGLQYCRNYHQQKLSGNLECRKICDRCYSSAQSVHEFTLSHSRLRNYIDKLVEEYEASLKAVMENTDSNSISKSVRQKLLQLQPLAEKALAYRQQETELLELRIITEDTEQDKEMIEMAQEDMKVIQEVLQELEDEILQLLVPGERGDDNDVILEVNAGVGGQEAMLFASELFNMYRNYAFSMGWTFIPLTDDETATAGGVRYVSANISGEDVYRTLKFEAGVHRVQRVPKTESKGRVHTSTVTVAVLPQASEIDVQINQKDLRIDTFCASGAGGQHVNKTESAVRIVHLPTGITSECQVNRSQVANRTSAFNMLRTKLYQKELIAQQSQIQSKRKLQVGTAGRSEKIRTYNFMQDRVTDHRVGLSLNNITNLMDGGEKLHELVDSLHQSSYQERLLEVVANYNDKSSKS